MDNKKLLPLIAVGVVGLILVIALSSSIFLTIHPGEAGVLFEKFGKGLDKEHVYGQGFHILTPWNTMHVYNIKEQTTEESMDVLDKNGLSISVEVSVRFNPMPNKIGYVHEIFGVNYVNVLVIPEVRSAVRQVMGRYSAEEIYSTKRSEVEMSIITETEKSFSDERNNIQMNALLIRSINLPANITQAIENKLRQEQEALAYEFRLQKETSEAERKRIAAEGEAAANAIINSSLTSQLLRMRGIEATTRLAESPNAKVVIIGSGKDGLPLILGGN